MDGAALAESLGDRVSEQVVGLGGNTLRRSKREGEEGLQVLVMPGDGRACILA